MNKKYELLTDQTITVLGRKLFRIRALVSFSDVEAGDEGGYVESESNLGTDGNAWVYGNAHYLCISPIGSRNDAITFFRTKEQKIEVAVGCFRGDIDQFEAKVRLTHGENEHATAYMLAAQLARVRIDLSEEERT